MALKACYSAFLYFCYFMFLFDFFNVCFNYYKKESGDSSIHGGSLVWIGLAIEKIL